MAGRVNPDPYAYPSRPHVRRHDPGGWKTYRKYLPWLRDEFSFRCVYCLDREVWRDMRERMPIDHFVPQAIRKDLKCEYTNLLYLCPACNSQKSDSLLPDPCSIALGQCLRVHINGTIEALDKEGYGARLIDVLALNDERTVEHRRLMIGTMLSLSKTDWKLFVQWMGFPKDLPNLTQNPPPHNNKPEGIASSYFERKRRGQLPEVY